MFLIMLIIIIIIYYRLVVHITDAIIQHKSTKHFQRIISLLALKVFQQLPNVVTEKFIALF